MKTLAILILAFIFHFAQAQPTFIKDSLDAHITKALKLWQVPGAAVAIVKDGKVVHLKGYGFADVATKTPVDENTLFMIGSNTKVFTATALTMLEQQKKLSLDDKVTKWIPYFKLNDPLASDAATVRDLLCHRIGFETFQGDFTYWASNLTRQEVIKKMAFVKAPYGFRTKWGYCNAAFTTAGEVIPAVTQTSWEDFIRTNILQPLKMNRTQMLARDLPKASNRALPYTIIDGKLTPIELAQIDNLAPAGTIASSVKDMVNWVMTQIDMGKFEGNQIIPAEAIAATRVPHTIVGMDPGEKRNTHFYLYGLGLDINDRAGKIVVSHTGGVDGFLSSVMIVPEEKLGIVILTNTDQNSFFQDITKEIRDSYLNLPYRGYTYQSLKNNRQQKLEEKKQLDSLKNLINPKNKPALPLASYAGSYANELYGDISIVLEKGSLVIRFSHHPQLTGKLDALKDNTFLCTYSSPTYGIKTFPFYVKEGKVTGFTLTVNDFVEFTPYEFVKK